MDDLIDEIHAYERANSMPTETFLNLVADGDFEGVHDAHGWLGAALALAELKGSLIPPPDLRQYVLS